VLAYRNTGQPVKIQQIAEAQDIPPRFLEAILNDLKHAGFVESRRGHEGGYLLSRDCKQLTVAAIMEAIEGPIALGPKGTPSQNGYLKGDYAFNCFWSRVNEAVASVCGRMTFSELRQSEMDNSDSAYHYSI
jgi:Rrf2 family protein